MSLDHPQTQPRLDTRALLTGEGLPECDQQVIRQCRNDAIMRFIGGGVVGGGLMHLLLARRRIMTPNRKFVVTTIFTLWSSSVAAFTASPACFERMSHIEDPNSILKKELKRVVVKHNPNTAQQHVNHKPPQADSHQYSVLVVR